MLTASQIDVLRAASEQLLQPVTDFLIEDIARRVSEAGQLTGTASYQVWRAQNLGISQRKLKKELQKKLDLSAAEVEKLLKQAAKTGYNFDLSKLPTSQAIPFSANSSIQQIVAATVKQAQKDLTNITNTMGFVCSDGKVRELTEAYQKACDDAFMRTVTGAQDYTSAIRDATRGLAEKGILSIDYASGRHFTIEAAVRQNIMGGLGLMQEQISQQNHDDLGCDGWEISAHAGSAPDHEPIQGRQYTDKEYKRLNNSLMRRIGTLNCGHAAFPIIMGVNAPQYTEEELEQMRRDNETGVTVDGRHYTTYEATQRQRQLERAIRNQKRKILIDKTVDDPDKLQTDQIRLVRLRDEYARFSKEAGLPTQHARAEAAGFTWKDGKAAEKVAKQKQNANISKEILANDTKDDTIKTKWDNNLPPRGQVTEIIPEGEHASWVAKELGISQEEATRYVDAVIQFTNADSEVYSDIRRYQRGEPLQILTEVDAKELSEDLEAYIAKAPRWNGGTTFRGSTVPNAELAEYQPGYTVTMGGMSSWSATQDVSRDFAVGNISQDRPNAVIYHCETQTKGTGIRHLSVNENEDEVLCSVESAYRVVRTETDNEGIVHVYVEEE